MARKIKTTFEGIMTEVPLSCMRIFHLEKHRNPWMNVIFKPTNIDQINLNRNNVKISKANMKKNKFLMA